MQALLKARGIAAVVANAGVPGDTTYGMRVRLPTAVPPAAGLVILQTGGNDERKGLGAEKAETVAGIKADLDSRGTKLIVLDDVLAIAPGNTHAADGQHMNAEGHAAIAAWLLPKVLTALGSK